MALLKLKPKTETAPAVPVSPSPVVQATVVRRSRPVEIEVKREPPPPPGSAPKVPPKAKTKSPKTPPVPKVKPEPTPEERAVERALWEQHRLEKRQKVRDVLTLMQSRWPALFPESDAEVRYPWKIGLRHEIYPVVVQAGIPCGKAIVSHAFERWMSRHSAAYRALLAQGGPRYGLEGQPCGEITEKEREAAKAALDPSAP